MYMLRVFVNCDNFKKCTGGPFGTFTNPPKPMIEIEDADGVLIQGEVSSENFGYWSNFHGGKYCPDFMVAYLKSPVEITLWNVGGFGFSKEPAHILWFEGEIESYKDVKIIRSWFDFKNNPPKQRSKTGTIVSYRHYRWELGRKEQGGNYEPVDAEIRVRRSHWYDPAYEPNFAEADRLLNAAIQNMEDMDNQHASEVAYDRWEQFYGDFGPYASTAPSDEQLMSDSLFVSRHSVSEKPDPGATPGMIRAALADFANHFLTADMIDDETHEPDQS